jgi:hypothetical protein
VSIKFLRAFMTKLFQFALNVNVLGVAFTDGDLWQQHRHFTMRHLRQLGFGRDGMENIISIECQALVDMLKTKCHSTEVYLK